MGRRALVAVLPVLLFAARAVAAPDVVEVPMHFDHAFMRALLVEQLHVAPDAAATLWADDTRCGFVELRPPEITTVGDRLRLVSAGEARLGKRVAGLCLAPLHWRGFLEAFLRAEIGADGRSIQLRMLASTLYDTDWRKPLITGAIWRLVATHFEPWIESARIDLGPAVRDVEDLLPLVLVGRERASLQAILDSVRLADPRVGDAGIDVALVFTVAAREERGAPPEPPLSAAELREARLDQWDAFLTFVVLEVADAGAAPELRRALADLLIEARFAIVAALAPARRADPDPVPALFIAAWERLAPLVRRRVAGLPATTALQYASFVAAGDALTALERLGPVLGVEISADGLRRLARALAPLAPEDPLLYRTQVDPALRAIFDFAPLDVPAATPPTPPGDEDGWLWRLLTPGAARAAGELERWVPPDRAGLEAYLRGVRRVLEAAGEQAIAGASFPERHREVYRHLLLATAWQESCWRQFVRRRGTITYLGSAAGAVGLMQVNERVWRGLYDRKALRWSIKYNGRAGAQILLRYLETHALEGATDESAERIVARAYAVYNAGPAILRRAKHRVPDRAVDRRLLEKYRAVRAGDETGVARCLVGA
jgi:Transglycosylase SLT domain